MASARKNLRAARGEKRTQMGLPRALVVLGEFQAVPCGGCAHIPGQSFASPKLGYMGGTGGYSFTISLARVRHFLNARFPVFPPVGSSVRIRGCKLAHGERTADFTAEKVSWARNY